MCRASGRAEAARNLENHVAGAQDLPIGGSAAASGVLRHGETQTDQDAGIETSATGIAENVGARNRFRLPQVSTTSTSAVSRRLAPATNGLRDGSDGRWRAAEELGPGGAEFADLNHRRVPMNSFNRRPRPDERRLVAVFHLFGTNRSPFPHGRELEPQNGSAIGLPPATADLRHIARRAEPWDRQHRRPPIDSGGRSKHQTSYSVDESLRLEDACSP